MTGEDRFFNASWRKSSHSGSVSDECVEIAGAYRLVGVRDSKNPDGPALAFSRPQWQHFTDHLKSSDNPVA